MTDTSSILVVDDDADSLLVLANILAAEGYQVRTADSGGLALKSVAAWLPELILLDVRMPGMDGFDVCQRLKAADSSRHVPVIFLTAAGDVDERVHGLAAGAVDYISKPFHREELLARVRTHLELERLRRDLEKQVSERTADLSNTVDRLRESEQRFRNMADAASMLIWVSSPDKLCTFVNKTWLSFTGRTLDEALGNGWSKAIHPDDLDRCVTAYTSAFDALQDVQMEYRLRRADGEYRSVLDTGSPLFAPSGAFVGYIGSAIDITEMKRIQENALSKQKLETLTSLTRGISHDFNNMLSAILVEAKLAEVNLTKQLTAGEEIHRIKAVALRASEIVRQLMIYSGQEEAPLEPLDLSALVEQISDLLAASISKQCSLHFDLDKGLPPVCGNAAQLTQLVMNLVINASQAIGEPGGRIHVKTSSTNPQHDGIRLEVSDTGCGMTEQERTRIFDPFFTTKPDGRGLGLPVVHGIARAHSAPINVASSPGKGTTFEVLFKSAGQRPAIAAPARDADVNMQGITGRVLLVDDHNELRLAITRELQKAGFSVIGAADGPSAMEAFRDRANDITVAVLDVSLPGLSGPEVFRQMRATNPDVKVIIASAYDVATMREAFGQGAAGFLQKPYSSSDLKRVLQLSNPTH